MDKPILHPLLGRGTRPEALLGHSTWAAESPVAYVTALSSTSRSAKGRRVARAKSQWRNV